jgi:arylsulfatase A-like enzyme/predicted Zn-dependent protease
MSRWAQAVLAACGLAAAAACTTGCARTPAPSELSVILVTLDTARADRIGAFGGKAVPTPNLDEMARGGTLFEQAFSQAPLTLPSHASMLTARYPASIGVRHNGLYRLRNPEPTLASSLGASGFETAAFVAAYVLNKEFGLDQGFGTYDDVVVRGLGGGEDQMLEAERTADEVNARVFDWLGRRRPGRFFLWVHYYDPHEPYRPPERPSRVLAGSGYDREISYVDACFGDLIRRLEDDGILDRSILVVAGDHGESLGEHGEDTHGFFLYDATLHVPLFIRAPGLVPAGRRVGGPVELVAVAPTILDLLSLPALEKAQGKSLRGRIDGTDDGRAAVAHAETLMPRLEYGLATLRMIRDGRYKYVGAPRPELYDIEKDPGEQRDLAALDANRSRDMASALSAWERATTDETASKGARRNLSREEEERLRSLGYLAGDFFKKGATAETGLPDPKDRIGEIRRVHEARMRLREGNAAAALAVTDEILRENPRSQRSRNTRIVALIQLERYAEAEKEALTALAAAEADRDNTSVLGEKARMLLASAYRLQGKQREAEEVYRRLLAEDARKSAVAVELASLLGETGRAAEGLRLLDEIRSREPRNGTALATRFEILSRQGDRAATLEAALALAESRAGDAATLVEAGLFLLEAGQPTSAATCFETAQQQNAEPDPELFGQIGAARMAAGQVDSARKAFLAMSRISPTDPRPHYYLGVIALETGDETGARTNFARALAIAPSFTSPLVKLGRYLASRGSGEEAARLFEDAIRRNPGDTEARKSLDSLRGAPSGRTPAPGR